MIIIGKNNFVEKIKIIEKDINIESIKYLQIKDIPIYIREKNKTAHKKNKIRVFFYFLIITYNKIVVYFENIIILLINFFYIFFIFIYF